MALYRDSGVSVESWIEMRHDVTMRYEVDRLNDLATLYFGPNNEYVMVLCRENLDQVVSLGAKAVAELDTSEAGR